MKEAIGGISIFQIVIIFILFFTGIMCLTINHSRAFGVKDEIITIIQNDTSNGTLSGTTIKEIATHLRESGYRITGTCPDKTWDGYDLNGEPNEKASFCIKKNQMSESFYNDAYEKCEKGDLCTAVEEDTSMFYYDVILFYQLDIPGLNNIMNFKLYGSTKVMFDQEK